MKSLRFLPILVSMLFALVTGSAFANPDLNCDAYAAKAVFQNNFAKNVGCGFSGSRWSDNYEGHKAWCLKDGVQMQNLTAEDNARIGALAQCQKVQEQACRSYADSAIVRAKNNVAYSCGLTDSAFDNNYDGHFKWCMSVHMNTAATETYNRNLEIGQCHAKKLDGICGFYVAAISPLYQKQNEACAGRDDFQLAASNPTHDRQECLKNTKLDAAWVNARVDAMNTRINTCEVNRITYDNPGWRGVALDHCTNHLGAFCREGDWVPNKFCEWKGHTSFDLAATSSSDIAVFLDCLKTGNVSAADESTQCYCRGNCGTYTSITCSGRK